MMSKSKQRIDLIRKGIIPDGYKKTKAGIIPADWEIHPLSQHLSESRIPGSNGSIAKKLSVKLWNKGVCEKREVHSGSESTKYYKRKKGQFIYSKLDFLNCAFGIIPEELDGYESTIDLPCFDLSDVNDYYFLSYITQPKFYSHYGMLADGGRKARRVDPEEMLSFPLVFPPLPEQQKIAEILSTQDKVIELKEKLLEQKQTQKKFLLRILLDEKLDAIISQNGWKFVKLGEICQKIGSGSTPKGGRKVYLDSGIPIIRSQNVLNGILDMNDVAYISKEQHQKMKGTWVYPNDILLNITGASIGRSCVVPEDIQTANVNQHVCIIRLKNGVNPIFVCDIILSDKFQKQIQLLSAGGGRQGLNFQQIASFKIFLPPLPEQQAIAEVLSTADKEIDLLKSDIEQEKQKKKALMQLLLTGIVRVKV